MSVLILEHVFDRDSTYHNISKYTTAIKNDVKPDAGFKIFLRDVEEGFRQDIQLLTVIRDLVHDELNILNKKIKRFNTGFDKLNDLYYDKDYLNDGEVKQLFSSISRQAHKVENASHKHLFADGTITPAPDYIKEELAKFSQETIGKKLTSEN